MSLRPNFAKVEGCDLQCWLQGKGPLLILVPSGMDDGKQFNNIIGQLDQHFTVVAYDRRQASSGNRTNKPLNTEQHYRDIIAILKSLSQDKISIFATFCVAHCD